MSKSRTSSYAFTVFNPNDKDKSEGLDELKKLRKTILTNHYVKCQGRWGRKNPNYNHRIISFCPLKHAVRWDVYFYKV